MGVVYYTRYLEYFEAARTEMLKSIGLIVTDIENEGFFLPVVSAHCDYKQSAKFEDEIIVRTSIHEMPKARMKIEYDILKNETVLTNVVMLSSTIKPPNFYINTGEHHIITL